MGPATSHRKEILGLLGTGPDEGHVIPPDHGTIQKIRKNNVVGGRQPPLIAEILGPIG